MILKNWKTTSAGLLVILGAVGHLQGHYALANFLDPAFATPLLAGIGLIFAHDSFPIQSSTPPPEDKSNGTGK